MHRQTSYTNRLTVPFVVGDGVLESPHTSNPRGVRFKTVLGADGTLFMTSIQGEPTSFRDMASGAIGLVGDTAAILELGGLAACPFTAGAGCVFAGAAGAVGVAAGVLDATVECTEDVGVSCFWSAGELVGEVSFAKAAKFMDDLVQLQGMGRFQAGVVWQGGTYALRGAFVIEDPSGLTQYVLML